jgi:hypothetical protein
VSCGTETGSSATTSTTGPPATTVANCDLQTGPAVITGTVTWLSGGIAGFNQATIEPAECSVAGPVPIINLAFDAFPVAASSTDCDGCPDALTTTSSPVVAVHGVIVPALDLPGEDLAPGSLVLVADGRAQAPQQLRYRALDVPEITWDLRTRFSVVDDQPVICEIDSLGCREGTSFAADLATGVEVPPLVGGVSDFVHVSARTLGNNRLIVESTRQDPIGS